MASVEKDSKGYRIRFIDHEGNRKAIRLGGMNKTNSEKIARHVEELVAWRKSGWSLDTQTAGWLSKVGQELHDKLSNAGLIDKRASSLLGEFVAGYIKGLPNIEPGTVMNLGTCERNLNDFFGADRPMRSITTADAKAFRLWLEEHEGQAENTLRRRCGRARQFFKAAIKAKLIEENPFEGMSVTVTGSTDKARFITEEESQKILKACPDAEWRLIFSLCRYGGMRCPSEILPLTWNDILWDASRVIVTSPKTKRYKGQESRVIPLFPELRKALDEAYELAFLRLNDQSGDSEPVATVSGPVVTRYSSASQNLRTTFNKIVKRAGLKPWPKPFQNLRATRETELMEIYPAHVVVSWIGHSEKVARQHYLQTTDAHFEKAVQPTPSDLVGHMVGHNMCETTQNGEPRNKASHVKPSVLRGSSGDFATTSYPVGTRTPTDSARNCCATNYTTE